jgi:hypothetical protein
MLVFDIPADLRTRLRGLDDLTVGHIVGQHLANEFLSQAKLRIGEHSRQFRRGGSGKKRNAIPFPSMRTNLSKPAIRKEESRHDGRGAEDDVATHLSFRAQATASVTSVSVIPSFFRRERTSSARPSRNGRSTIVSPSVLTSKYSTLPNREMTAFGSVIWFLTVFFASMDAFARKQEDLTRQQERRNFEGAGIK